MTRVFVRVGLACAIAGSVLVVAGCSGGANPASGSTTPTAPVGANMAGPAANVVVTAAALESRPAAWDLSTPQNAVSSYLAWTSYAYRIATSNAASATMGSDEFVRVDAYIQLNLEKGRLIDQSLTSIAFGKPSVQATETLVPTKEKWTYRYVSIKSPGGETLAGPYTASYDATYTVTKSSKGWVVASVVAKAHGTVK